MDQLTKTTEFVSANYYRLCENLWYWEIFSQIHDTSQQPIKGYHVWQYSK